MAGDTVEAAALVATWPAATTAWTELGRLRRSSHAIGETIATQPSPELRARTLALVDRGRPRSLGRGHAASPAELPAGPDRRARSRSSSTPEAAASSHSTRLGCGGRGCAPARRRRHLDRGDRSPRAQEIREQARDIAALGQLTAWQLRIEARDDAERVLLASTTPAVRPATARRSGVSRSRRTARRWS